MRLPIATLEAPALFRQTIASAPLSQLTSPLVCSHHSQSRGFAKTTLSGPSAAFQYLYLEGKNGAAPYAECHRLSADVASHPGNETWSLVEPGNPSRGVQVRYEGGDLCCANGMSSCTDPQPRSLELQFFCKDDTSNVFDRETVLEYGKCHYKIWLDTASGCPTREPDRKGALQLHSRRTRCTTRLSALHPRHPGRSVRKPSGARLHARFERRKGRPACPA